MFTVVTMLALLFGSQLCTLVNCASPRAHAAPHACCAAAAARAATHTKAAGSAPHACDRPCCIEIALTHAPELNRPLATNAHALAACLAVAAELAAAPRVTPLAPSPPGDAAAPPPPPRSAAGVRAPPLA
jgi:hypothetical protein